MAKINHIPKAVVLNQNHVLAAIIAFFLLIYALVPPVESVQPAEIERPPIVTVAPCRGGVPAHDDGHKWNLWPLSKAWEGH